MAVKMKFEEFISDMKSITQMPMFSLSPARKAERDDGDVKKDEKVKTKILEAWNNIRYDLGPIATLKKDIPIWILGVCHHSRSATDLASVEAEEEDNVFDSPLDRRIYTDFASRPRFTYRKNFPPISGTDITTDTGWGCMLRSAQMMIAQGLLLHFLGRDWRWLTNADPIRRQRNLHKEIIGWFIDDPSCPLSIHRLSEIGRKFGNMPGNWYGPNTAAHIMQNAVKEAEENHPMLKQVAVYVALHCTVYSEDVYDLCDWRNSIKTENDINEKFPQRIYSSTSSGSLKLPSRADFASSETPSPFSPNTAFSIDPTVGVDNTRPSLNQNLPRPISVDTPATVDRELILDDRSASSEHADNMVSADAINVNKSSIAASPLLTNQESCVPANDERSRLESWCEVPGILPSESYEDFKKYPKETKQPTKFSFTISKKKKKSISLYENDRENDDAILNGRVIIPHFQVGAQKQTSKQAQKPPRDTVTESFMMSPCTSKASDAVTKKKGVRQKLRIDNDVKNSNKKHAVVTPETPSPILYRRKESLTGESEILRSPDVLMSKLSFFKWDERSKVDSSQDEFLSSHLEPVIPDQLPSYARLSARSKSAKRTENRETSPLELTKISLNQNPGTKSRFQASRSDKNSEKYGNSILSSRSEEVAGDRAEQHDKKAISLSPGKMSNTQPIAIEPSKTRDKSRLLRRSSSTPNFSPRSSTNGEFPHTPRGSQKNFRKRSVPASKTGHHKAVLVLIPVRLGENALNPIYAPCVEAMLSLGSSIGIIGGRPKHSLYFVGCQGQGLLHLDPHYCQPADTPTGYGKNLHDYHTTQIRKVNVKKMDPSCCLGFYCRTPDEFEEFKIQSQKNFTPPQQSVSYPMCLIMEGRSGDHEIKSTTLSPDDIHEPNFSKNASLSTASSYVGVDVGDNSPIRKTSITGNKQDSEGAMLKKKKRGDAFRMDDVSSTLNKLNPLAKLMRKSPTAKRKSPGEHEELESQFELL